MTVETVEEKVDVLDRKEARRGKAPNNKEYFMKFVCAAMSSAYGLNAMPDERRC